MINMNDERFGRSEFAIQVIAKGSYIDSGSGDNPSFIVETTTNRMNHIALNAWPLSAMFNCRDCRDDGADGDKEWEDHKAEYAARCEAVRKKIIDDLGIDPDN